MTLASRLADFAAAVGTQLKALVRLDQANVTASATALDGTETVVVLQGTGKKSAISLIRDWLVGIANTWTGKQTFSGGLALTKTNVTAPAAGDGNVYSGTYTPVSGGTHTNVATVSFNTLHYIRVGDEWAIGGSISITPAGAGNCLVLISPPVPMTFSSAAKVGGTAVNTASTNRGLSAGVYAVTASDCIGINFDAVTSVSLTFRLSLLVRSA